MCYNRNVYFGRHFNFEKLALIKYVPYESFLCYLFSNIRSGVMDHRKIYKIIVTFFYAICFIAFFIWLIQAIDNYQSLATSSKVSFKHGDDGDKMVRFPSFSICESGNFEDAAFIWKNMISCRGKLSPPFFLSYLEDCLESKENNDSIVELIKSITFEKQELISRIGTLPKENSFLNSEGEIELHNCGDDYGYDYDCDSIIHSQYHYHYGHCLTLDISSLSPNNNGKYSVKFGSQRMKIQLLVKGHWWCQFGLGVDCSTTEKLMFFHNGTNINQLGDGIDGRILIRDYQYDVSLFL